MKRDLIAYAHSLGFARIGITSAEPLVQPGTFLESWIEEGRAGEMDYLSKNPSRRARPTEHLPGAKSVIALAMSYYSPSHVSLRASEAKRSNLRRFEKSEIAASASPKNVDGKPPRNDSFSEGRIARYAWGKEYHRVIRKRVESLVRYIEALEPGTQCRTFVDTGPLLERALAQRAGVGFIGKNTMVISKGLGSWNFLACVVTTLDVPPDEPDARSCGSCTLCIDACPTEAISSPYQLDARRCIAYLTIEVDGAIPEPLREKTGEWLFGCDICQDVCPHNTRVPETTVEEFRLNASPGLSLAYRQARPPSPLGRGVGGEAPRGVGPHINLEDVLSMRTEEAFQNRFAGTPLARAERHGLIRNACLTAVHLERTDLIPALQSLAAEDPHPVVREHAAWALQQLPGTPPAR